MEVQNFEYKNLQDQIADYQPKLLSFSYNILGDLMEAEDIVQQALNNFFLNPQDHVRSPFSYLVRAVINKSINQKKALARRRDDYIGPWLPAPIFTEDDIYSKADNKAIVNYSLLVLLEKLNARERAVFILKETFDFSHQEIAEALDVTIENSRQLLSRARKSLDAGQKSASI